MYGLKKRSKQDESGLIQGAGTGTSDSVKKNVPAGSYIMPADSTQTIGAENLENMGHPTPVNLSNGEFQLSPDEVHSVGVQALENMKNQTHVLVDQPQLGFKPGQNKPELFFANGGLIPFDEKANKIKPNTLPSTQHQQQYVPKQPNTNLSEIRTAGQSKIIDGAYRNVQHNNLSGRANSQPPTNRPGYGTAQSGGMRTVTPTTTSGNVKFPQFNVPTTGQMLKSTAVNAAKGLGKAHVGLSIAGGLYQGKDTTTDEYRERFGFDEPKYDGSFTEGAKEAGTAILGKLSDIGNAASFGILGRNFADKQRHNAENALAEQQKRYAEWNARKNNQSVPMESSQSTAPAMPAQNQQQNTQQNDPYAIQQNGNSFSYANPGAAAQAREQGIPEGQASNVVGGIRPVNDPRGVANLFANTREMGASEQQIQDALARREMNIGLGMRGYGNIPSQPEAPQRTPEQEAERQSVIRAVSTPIAGARGLTANQVRTLSDLQQGDDNRANQRYTTDANNSAALQREAMGQAGQNYRTELGEQGTNNRFNANLGFDAQKFQATNDLANREFNLNATEKGFGIRNSARLEKLYEQYDKAETDEDRKSIQEKINRYTGGGKADTGKDRYMTVGGGQRWDDKAQGTLTQPQQLFDTQTQQFIDSQPTQQSSNDGAQYKEGQVYTDANGNRAVFRNGQFQAVK